MPKLQIQLAYEAILTLLVSISAIVPPFARAQTDPSSSSSPGGVEAPPQDTRNYWTQERLRSAKPMELHPTARPDASPEATPPSAAPSKRGEGNPPQGK